MFKATPHAIQRFTERFAGNLSPTVAGHRLEKMAAQARYVHDVPGHAKLYATQHIAFIIKDRHILTVYPRSARTCNNRRHSAKRQSVIGH